MSTTYDIKPGDTFSSIAREKLGDDNLAQLIARANPGAAEPLTDGVLTIPDVPGAPQDITQQSASNDPDEIGLMIDGVRFKFWETIVIQRTIDAMDTVMLSAPFDANSPEFRSAFRPFSYSDIVVNVGGSPLFTGTMINVDPVVDPRKKIVEISGYSLPGVLDDCTPFASSFPLEFNNVGIKSIADTLVAPFGVSVELNADAGAVFERVAIDPGKRILTFISDLARQRNMIITSSPDGSLVFTQSVSTGSPVARLEQGSSPLMSVAAVFNPQAYFSHITGIEPVFLGLTGSQFSTKNPFLTNKGRPFTYGVDDTQAADVKVSVDAKMGRMFANVASYTVNVSTWRDINGNLWEPNTTIMLLAPDAMVYEEFEFVIRSVTLIKDSNGKSAELTLVIPGSFAGEIPEAVPWAS